MADAPFGTHAPNSFQRTLLGIIRSSRLKRGAFRPLMSCLIGPSPIDTTYQGASMRLHHHDSGTERGALFNPGYNIEELDFLRQHLPDGGIFIDIGANAGTFAVVLARHVGVRGRVIAIEPHPVSHARLRFNVNTLPLRNVTLVEAALGDVEGDVTIGTTSSNLGAARVGQGDFKVASRRLNAVLHDNGIAHIDALKIDVEGHEDKVLMPFFREAPAALWPTAVTIEHLERAHWADDCINDMAARGYRVTGLTRSNTFLVRPA